MLEEIVHNLDYCDILVLGEELREGLETLQLPHSALLGKHLDYTNSTSGMSIYGKENNTENTQILHPACVIPTYNLNSLVCVMQVWIPWFTMLRSSDRYAIRTCRTMQQQERSEWPAPNSTGDTPATHLHSRSETRYQNGGVKLTHYLTE